MVAVGNDYVWVPETGNHANCGGNGNWKGYWTGSLCSAGFVTFLFDISIATEIKFEAEMVFPTRQSDSFFISVDGGSRTTWHIGNCSQTWAWRPLPSVGVLSKGNHILKIMGREDGVKLRRVRIKFSNSKSSGCFRGDARAHPHAPRSARTHAQ